MNHKTATISTPANPNHKNVTTPTTTATIGPNNKTSRKSTASSSCTERDTDSETIKMLMANLPSNALVTSTPNPRLQRAYLETERTNKITPLLKEELRCRILNKRMEQGEPEIDTLTAEPHKYELTDEEKIKRERRKAQNRQAAKRCREKRKRKQLNEAEAAEQTREQNQLLTAQVTELRNRYTHLMKLIQEHQLSGHCHLPEASPAHVLTETSGKQLLPSSKTEITCGEKRHLPTQLHPAIPAPSLARVVVYPSVSMAASCPRQASPQQNQVLIEDPKIETTALAAGSSNQSPLSASVGIVMISANWPTKANSSDPHVAETLPSQQMPAETMTNSLPQSLHQTVDALRTAQGLRALSSDDVSAILPDSFDLNLSEPSSDTNSPVQNPTCLFPSSPSLVSLSVQNISGFSLPNASSLNISNTSSGISQNSSLSNNDQFINQSDSGESLSFQATIYSSFPSLPGNKTSTFHTPPTPNCDHELATFFANKKCADLSSATSFGSSYPSENLLIEQSPFSPLGNECQQNLEFSMAPEFSVKTEEAMDPTSSQFNIETLLDFLPSDRNGGRSETPGHALKENPAVIALSPMTPQSSPPAPFPGAVCADLRLSDYQSYQKESVGHSSPSASSLSFEPAASRKLLCSSTHTVGTVCVQPTICPPKDLAMTSPVHQGITNAAHCGGNIVITKPRATLRRSSLAPYSFTSQLSSSSSSASPSTLSPPPSVPSPSPSSSHEVPESPNILFGNSGCYEEGRSFGHHLSPVGRAISTHQSPTHLENISSDDDGHLAANANA
ncbi:proto-oncogene c-fos-like [Plakobranchus ocellatus]|uniref:Proto-oncogene c-fos-like n=1 Tax=Plakobranchus ocellatus TaxID=259542 RepID=A0AAV4CSJ7_9GAST|nr:proto-oncogene c-fos-like [Plakobranchus ocellatus]